MLKCRGCLRPRAASCASDCGRSPGRPPTAHWARLRRRCRRCSRSARRAAANRRRDGAALLKMEMHVALQVDGEAEIGARREDNHAAACGRCRFDGAIDGGGVEGLAVAGCAVRADIEDARAEPEPLHAGDEAKSGTARNSDSGNTVTADPEEIAAKRVERCHTDAIVPATSSRSRLSEDGSGGKRISPCLPLLCRLALLFAILHRAEFEPSRAP